jgi:hypothetical protein
MFIALPGADSYGPLPMRQGTRPGIEWWALCTWRRTLTVIVCSTLLSACARAGGGATAKAVRITRAHSQFGADARRSGSSTTVHMASVGPVISAWVAAQRPFDDAARTADADAPELAATMVAPQLPWTQALLGSMPGEGEEARGPVSFGRPRVETQATDLAVVDSCVHDSEIVVSAATGRAVAGLAGQSAYELVASTMEQANSGWKLETQAVRVGACDGS